jgi:hypothetical protein
MPENPCPHHSILVISAFVTPNIYRPRNNDFSCYDAHHRPMKALLDLVVGHRSGALFLLLIAALLEAYGDSCFQAGLYRSSGISRMLAFVLGAASLVSYGLVVNAPRWEFGNLLGVYVVFFFLCAQIIARVKFGQVPSTPVIIGGALIVAGGIVITLSGH